MSNFLSLCAADMVMVDGNWSLIWSTVVTGIAVVFLILAILVFLLWLMGKIFSAVSKSAEKKKTSAAEVAAKTKTETPAPVPVAEEYEDEDDAEIIAVISAAIAAYGESEGKRYNITSVKKRDKAVRSPWSMAGVSDNTRGF